MWGGLTEPQVGDVEPTNQLDRIVCAPCPAAPTRERPRWWRPARTPMQWSTSNGGGEVCGRCLASKHVCTSYLRLKLNASALRPSVYAYDNKVSGAWTVDRGCVVGIMDQMPCSSTAQDTRGKRGSLCTSSMYIRVSLQMAQTAPFRAIGPCHSRTA